MRFITSNVQLLLLASAFLVSRSNASSATAPIPASAPAATTNDGGGNFVVQMAGFLKDSLVRTVDGTKEMWGNHGKCKTIRAKQKDFRDNLKKQWEFEEQLTPQEMRKKLQSVNGGITYEEFIFLRNGKDDRGKLMNMMFLMWGAPRVFPYAMMFYPDILPAPFAPLPAGSGKETKLEKLSRQRSHAVIQTLIALENEARATPAFAKLNIFGRKKQERTMDMIDGLGRSAAKLMSTPGAQGGAGAQVVMKDLDNHLYKLEPFTRAEKRLVNVPNSIVLGLMKAINGPQPLSVIMPNAMRRGNVLTHIQKIMEADTFLVEEKVDLDNLSRAMLKEACNERMIGSPGRTDAELREGLTDWLNLVVVQPNSRTEQSGENFNDNLARTALASYFSIDGTRDSRSASYLPRLTFQGQTQSTKEDKYSSKGKRN